MNMGLLPSTYSFPPTYILLQLLATYFLPLYSIPPASYRFSLPSISFHLFHLPPIAFHLLSSNLFPSTCSCQLTLFHLLPSTYSLPAFSFSPAHVNLLSFPYCLPSASSTNQFLVLLLFLFWTAHFNTVYWQLNPYFSISNTFLIHTCNFIGLLVPLTRFFFKLKSPLHHCYYNFFISFTYYSDFTYILYFPLSFLNVHSFSFFNSLTFSSFDLL